MCPKKSLFIYGHKFHPINIRGDTIRGHQITADTIPAHNFGINKFLHPYLITKFYIHFSPLKTQVHITQKIPLTRIKSNFLR